jgi:hypothetical protein
VTGGGEDPPLGENPLVGRSVGWDRVTFVRRGPHQRRRVVYGAGP